jgi:hypothetical protein
MQQVHLFTGHRHSNWSMAAKQDERIHREKLATM